MTRVWYICASMWSSFTKEKKTIIFLTLPATNRKPTFLRCTVVVTLLFSTKDFNVPLQQYRWFTFLIYRRNFIIFFWFCRANFGIEKLNGTASEWLKTTEKTNFMIYKFLTLIKPTNEKSTPWQHNVYRVNGSKKCFFRRTHRIFFPNIFFKN